MIDTTPIVSSNPNRSRAVAAITNSRINRPAYNANRTTAPTKPHSSARTAKMKSVCFSGRKSSRVCVPSKKPLPHIMPEPTATLDWMT